MAKRSTKTAQTPRQRWLDGFFAQECCGQPMSTGYDVVMLSCRHNDHTSTEEEAYYAMCNGHCGDSETLCAECVAEAVAEAAA